MKRNGSAGQARITRTPASDGSTVVRLTDCVTGDILFEHASAIREELANAVYLAWATARTQGFEVVE
jgi:hypothetical protein